MLEAYISGIIRNPILFKQAELVFYGKGPLKDSLKRRVEECGISKNVYIGTQVAHEKMPFEIEKAIMLVIGSRMDTSPNVITEAHAVGIPVIGTNAGGIPEMIEDGKDGYVLPVDDAETMSQRMEVLLNEKERCVEMGSAGREKVKKLNNPSRIADEHLEFYTEILNGKNI